MSMASPKPKRWMCAAGVAAGLQPASALACGFCTDAELRRQFWGTSVALALLIGLGAEALAYRLYLTVTRRETGYPRARVLFTAGVATLVVLMATQGSLTFMAAMFSIGLFASFVRSLVEDSDYGLPVVAWRVLLPLVAAVAWVATTAPTQVRSTALVRLALIAPDSWGTAPWGWVEEQLLRRPDAKAEVEGRIAALDKVAGPRAQDVELFRLHRLLGGDPAKHAALCRKWGVTATTEPTITGWHDRPLPPDGLLSRLCFPAAELERPTPAFPSPADRQD